MSVWTITYFADGKTLKFKSYTECKYKAIEAFKRFIAGRHNNVRMISCLEDSRTDVFFNFN